MSLDQTPAAGKIITARAARAAAARMDIGNVVAVLAPLPLGVLWLGASVPVYALHRHHPNLKVGEYSRRALYRLYGVIGAVLGIASFFPGRGIIPWLVAWALAALILVPWSIRSLIRIRRDTWEDLFLPTDRQEPADV